MKNYAQTHFKDFLPSNFAYLYSSEESFSRDNSTNRSPFQIFDNQEIGR
jgi:hypothetical protein